MAGNSTNGDLRSLADLDQRVERRNSDSPPAEVISAWLVSRLSTLLAIEPPEIDTREPFASYGLGSTELVSLSGELGEWLGRQLSLSWHMSVPPSRLSRGIWRILRICRGHLHGHLSDHPSNDRR